MKLRILGNSIRLRLTQSEVRKLLQAGSVSETTQFGPNNLLTYELTLSPGIDFMVNFYAGKIFVGLPKSIGEPWANGSSISLQHHIQTDTESTLSILIEKDFKCKTERVGENEDDMFPNPDEC